jgi:uncharacterized membrane protein YeaQ/YmgE (transglycosylase-associated protein family)
MGFILWLIIGGIVGWLASRIMKTDAQQGILTNILVGILGAFLGSQLLGNYSINTGISIRSILVSLFGAVVLLGLINLIRRGRVR